MPFGPSFPWSLSCSVPALRALFPIPGPCLDHGMSMRQKGEIIGKLGKDLFPSFFNGLGRLVTASSLDVNAGILRLRSGQAPGLGKERVTEAGPIYFGNGGLTGKDGGQGSGVRGQARGSGKAGERPGCPQVPMFVPSFRVRCPQRQVLVAVCERSESNGDPLFKSIIHPPCHPTPPGIASRKPTPPSQPWVALTGLRNRITHRSVPSELSA
jgi:hypothetical protein